jgi:uncharacterized protein YukE
MTPMDDELRQLLKAMRQENAATRDENAAMHGDTRRYFDVVAEGLRHQIQQLAEGLQDTRETLAREAADIRQEMRHGFVETQAMIKFSHSELDRRVRALEDGQRTTNETLAEVQARLDRLESSTH